MIEDALLNRIKGLVTSTKQIYWAQLPQKVDYKKGAVKIFLLPSQPPASTRFCYWELQASCWHTDNYSARALAHEVEDAVMDFSGAITDDGAVVYKVNLYSNGIFGELFEDSGAGDSDDRVWHVPVGIGMNFIKAI
jgi:hypothetical protein